jgi:hypothetical protein
MSSARFSGLWWQPNPFEKRADFHFYTPMMLYFSGTMTGPVNKPPSVSGCGGGGTNPRHVNSFGCSSLEGIFGLELCLISG